MCFLHFIYHKRLSNHSVRHSDFLIKNNLLNQTEIGIHCKCNSLTYQAYKKK